MRDVVIIEKWPSLDTYYNVFFHGKCVGAVNGVLFRFTPFPPHDRLLDCDKELIAEHVDEFICVLKITNRMTS